jgi:Xaa-Pro aminopeptidase
MEPTLLEKECYTKVLQGHIDLSSAVFPAGTHGYKLDIIARLPLFSSGKNYAHGTG